MDDARRGTWFGQGATQRAPYSFGRGMNQPFIISLDTLWQGIEQPSQAMIVLRARSHAYSLPERR